MTFYYQILLRLNDETNTMLLLKTRQTHLPTLRAAPCIKLHPRATKCRNAFAEDSESCFID